MEEVNEAGRSKSKMLKDRRMEGEQMLERVKEVVSDNVREVCGSVMVGRMNPKNREKVMR